jgi:putative aldouronate transport system permease protein
MFLSIAGAYALSKKRVMGRNIMLGLILFTMLFSGGLIPVYLTVSGLGLVNSIWAMILPTAISAYYLIIMKNYFISLPPSMEEAAKIDGANEITVLIRIILPISLPFMATFALFYAVERWNEWYNSMLYINERTLAPLQIYLREVLISMSTQLTSQAQAIVGAKKVFTTSIQMATIVVSAAPIICVYPFVQKYFVKGIMVGGLKE